MYIANCMLTFISSSGTWPWCDKPYQNIYFWSNSEMILVSCHSVLVSYSFLNQQQSHYSKNKNLPISAKRFLTAAVISKKKELQTLCCTRVSNEEIHMLVSLGEGRTLHQPQHSCGRALAALDIILIVFLAAVYQDYCTLENVYCLSLVLLLQASPLIPLKQ